MSSLGSLIPGVSTPRPVSSSEARYRAWSLSASARGCVNEGISKVQAEKAKRKAKIRVIAAARARTESRSIKFRMMIPRPDTVDDDLQVNRRTGILEECDLGNWPGQKLFPAEALAVAGDSCLQPRGHRRTGKSSLLHRDMVRLRQIPTRRKA